MKSPIFHSKFLGVHMDLSQLVEVGSAQLLERTHPQDFLVGFSYRYADGWGPCIGAGRS